MKSIIIQASSRSKGNTSKINEMIKTHLECNLIDLTSFEISPYDYEHKNRNDDFLKLMRKITEYDLIIFSTPVYWYSPSGIMKNFFDRITDCLTIEKETGRKLRGKYMAAICCGSDNNQIENFFDLFKKSAKYLGMNYICDVHTWIEDEFPSNEVQTLIKSFTEKIKSLDNL